MQFGLINAPATFQKRINSVLGEYLDEFITIEQKSIGLLISLIIYIFLLTVSRVKGLF